MRGGWASALLAFGVSALAGNASAQETRGSWGLPFTVGIYHAQLDLHDVRRCSAGRYGSLGLEAQRGGAFFALGGLELFSPWAGIDDCQVVSGATVEPDGRLRVASLPQLSMRGPHGHLRIGGGWAVRGRDIGGEVRALIGLTRGQEDSEGDWFPTISGSIGAVAVRHVVLHFETRWLNVPQWVVFYPPGTIPYAPNNPPSGSETRHNWQRMMGLSVGWRF